VLEPPALTHDDAQAIHEWLQDFDSEHDDSACVCGCWDCTDLYHFAINKPCRRLHVTEGPGAERRPDMRHRLQDGETPAIGPTPVAWERCKACDRYEWCASMDSGPDRPEDCDRDIDGRRKIAKLALNMQILDTEERQQVTNDDPIAIGGLFRCCTQITIPEAPAGMEGDIIECRFCHSKVTFTDGAWRWYRPKKEDQ
jgi:hypothetical protein